MSFNIVDLIKNELGSQVMGHLGGALGAGPQQTSGAVAGVLPSLLSGLTNASSSPRGAGALFDAVQNHDAGFLGDMSNLLGGNQAGKVAANGNSLLSSLMGNGALSQLAGAVSKFAGVNKANGSSLIGMLAPVIMGVLKRKVFDGGLNAGSLANMMMGQKDNINAAMPENFSTELKSVGFFDSISPAGLSAMASPELTRFGSAGNAGSTATHSGGTEYRGIQENAGTVENTEHVRGTEYSGSVSNTGTSTAEFAGNTGSDGRSGNVGVGTNRTTEQSGYAGATRTTENQSSAETTRTTEYSGNVDSTRTTDHSGNVGTTRTTDHSGNVGTTRTAEHSATVDTARTAEHSNNVGATRTAEHSSNIGKAEYTASTSEAPVKSSGGGFLKWLLPLLALLGLGWVGLQFLNKDAAEDSATEAVGSAASGASNAVEGAAESATGAVKGATESVAGVTEAATSAVSSQTEQAQQKATDALNAAQASMPEGVDLAAISGGLNGVFDSTGEALSGITDVESAKNAIPGLEDAAGKLGGLNDMITRLPEAAQGPIGSVVQGGMSSLQPIVDKVSAIPGVGAVIEPVVGPLMKMLGGLGG